MLRTEPSQSRPFPTNPGLHVQLFDPLVLLQKASILQSCNPSTHSLMSERMKYSIINNRTTCESSSDPPSI